MKSVQYKKFLKFSGLVQDFPRRIFNATISAFLPPFVCGRGTLRLLFGKG